MGSLADLDSFIIAAVALLIIALGTLKSINGVFRKKTDSDKTIGTPPKGKTPEVARTIIVQRADKDQAKIDDASEDGQKLSDLVNHRRRKR